jgi:general secretion pathway protein J
MAYFENIRKICLPNTTQAFTLLEIIVALAIFAIMATMAYSGLMTVLTARQQIEQQAVQLAQLQMAFTWLGRDIEQLVRRPIRDQYGDHQPILQGSSLQLELTHAGWNNPIQQPRSSLQRVAYYLEKQTLWRAQWWTLDRAATEEPVVTSLLAEVTMLQLRYLDEHLDWHEQWISANSLTNTPVEQPSLPKLQAIEVTLISEKLGEFVRLFQVPIITIP